MMDTDGGERRCLWVIHRVDHLKVEVDIASLIPRRIRIGDVRRDKPLPRRHDVHEPGDEKSLRTDQHCCGPCIATAKPKLLEINQD